MNPSLALLIAAAMIGSDGPRDGAAILEALRGRDEAAKLAAAGVVEETLKEDHELGQMHLDYEVGAITAEEMRKHRLPGLGLGVDQIIAPLVSALSSDDGELRKRAQRSLNGLRFPLTRPVVPELLGLLADARPEVKIRVMVLFVGTGPGGDDRIPAAVLARWRDTDPSVQSRARKASKALILGDGDIAAAVAGLRPFLSDPDPRARIAALGCLATAGAPSRAARAEIAPFLRDPDPEARFDAACAILRIDRRRKTAEAEAARSIFLDLVTKHERFFFRGSSFAPEIGGFAEAVCALGSRAVGPILREQEKLERIRSPLGTDLALLQALGGLGPDGREAIPFLKRLLDGPDRDPRRMAATTLARIDPADADLVRALIGSVRGRGPIDRDHAIWVLGSCGPAARAAIPALEDQLADPRYERSSWGDLVADALARVAPGDPRAIAVLTDSLGSSRSDREVFVPNGRLPAWQAIETLGLQGPQGRDAIPLIRRAAEEGKGPFPSLSHAALFKIDPSRRDSLRALILRLDSPDQQIRIYAATALGGIGPPAAEAIPRLDRLTLDRTRLVRDSAEEALEKIRPDPDGRR